MLLCTTLTKTNRIGRSKKHNNMKEIFLNNWAEICLAILTAAGTITALTETEKDDKVIDVLKRILNAVVLGRSKRRNKE